MVYAFVKDIPCDANLSITGVSKILDPLFLFVFPVVRSVQPKSSAKTNTMFGFFSEVLFFSKDVVLQENKKNDKLKIHAIYLFIIIF